MTLRWYAALLVWAVWFTGCTTGNDIHLTGKSGEVFRRLTGAGAITPSEKVTIYGTEEPPSAQLQCHEAQHKAQAAVIADALVAIGAIDDDDISRMWAWLTVYAGEHLQRGYSGSRFELGARKACEGQ